MIISLNDTAAAFENYFKTLSVYSLRKFKRNKLRIFRRKRSRSKYWAYLRALRLKRHSQEGIEDSFALLDFATSEENTMEITNRRINFVRPIEEVSSWQTQHQVAYWKSRAAALEYENNMLHRQLKHIYTRQIQEYVEYHKEQISEMPNVADNSAIMSERENRINMNEIPSSKAAVNQPTKQKSMEADYSE